MTREETEAKVVVTPTEVAVKEPTQEELKNQGNFLGEMADAGNKTGVLGRLVAAQELGRGMKKEEIVDHVKAQMYEDDVTKALNKLIAEGLVEESDGSYYASREYPGKGMIEAMVKRGDLETPMYFAREKFSKEKEGQQTKKKAEEMQMQKKTEEAQKVRSLREYIMGLFK